MALDAAASALRLNHTQYRLLALLRANERLSVGGVSNLLGLSAPAVWNALTPLIRRRLVRSRRSPEDGRVRMLSLSEAGTRAEKRLSDAVREQLALAAKSVGRRDWAAWRRATNKLAEPCREAFE